MKKVLMIVCGFALLLSVGCLTSKPKAVKVPPYDPGKIAANAMKLYDKDGDKKLSADELKASPGLLYSLKCGKSIDTDGDGKISENEIKERIQAWLDAKVGLSCPMLKFVDSKGNPVTDMKDKKVVLSPDPVHEGLKETTPIAIDENAQCSPSTPDNMDNLSGMPFGFYTIKFDENDKVPYKNLGVEIFDGAKEDDADSFKIELKKETKKK